MKVVIIGGVAGGATAAARIRRLDEDAHIVIFERSGYISYANCGLPYYIGGSIKRREALTLQTPDSFWQRFRIDARVRHEVLSIDPARKTVTVNALDRGKIYEETYDKLILSPGAKPVKPDIQGADDEKVFCLRTVEDTFRIKAYIEEHKPESAVIAGGGYIGLEMAENLLNLGLSVTIVQRPEQLMNTLDYDMACQVHSYIRSKGINLSLKSTVQKLERDGGQIVTHINGREPLRSDMVILALGVTPESSLAKAAGLELGVKGSIVVNEHMQTSEPDIYAAGDAVEVRHFVTGGRALISLAGPANKQGRIAADNICGRPSVYEGSQGSSILKLFDMTIASTGITEKEAKARSIDYEAVVLTPASHAAYYPGAMNMTMKVLFKKDDGLLLGAQITGFEGADKRTDVLATAIRARMTAYDLTELDLAYAPPYSSAKDPVNMAGYVMENILTRKVRQFGWKDVEKITGDKNAVILDVRTEGEYKRGYIEGAKHIPLDDLRERLDELKPALPVYVYCQSGLRSYLACRILSQNGYECLNLAGGYGFYSAVMKDRAFDGEAAHSCGIKIS